MKSNKPTDKLRQLIANAYAGKLPLPSYGEIVRIPVNVPIPADVTIKLRSLQGYKPTRGRGKKTSLKLLLNHSDNATNLQLAGYISSEYKMKIYRVDLSKIIGKYIGETEKNIDAVFKKALAANYILLFDEGEALFGKRTEVKDAHDKYANQETAYLLQRIEDHKGIVLLNCNLPQCAAITFLRSFDTYEN